MVLTDGQENVSNEYKTNESIKTLIDEVKDSGFWAVSFMGCGDGVFDVAESFGVDRGSTVCYTNDSLGTTEAFTTMSTARSMRSASYSANIEKGLDTQSLNLGGKFFENMDLDDDDVTKDE